MRSRIYAALTNASALGVVRYANLCNIVLLCIAAVPSTAQRADPKDWPTYSGTDNGQRYSVLKQVTTANANRLQAKWVYHMDGVSGMEQVPVVMNGVMYISQFNRVD